MPDTKGRRVASKKALILEYRAAHHLEQAGMPELQAIRAELRHRLGDAGQTSVSYIARVLRDAGTRLQVPTGPESLYLGTSSEEPYATRLKGLLQFGNLHSAEESLRNLDAAYREYSAAADRAGIKSVRAVALKGRQRAQSLGANPRISPAKRQEKREIASWFRVWLQSPDLFSDWLELRKNSEDFQHLFGEADEERGC